MKAVLLSLLLCTVPALANEKAQYTYQDGVLQGSQRIRSGNDCIEGSAGSGSAATPGPSSCADQYTIVYTVESGGAIYILAPRGDNDPCKCGLLMRATIRHSVLDREPPHTAIKLRSDGRHFFVKIGNRESEYSVARVQ